jgi:hyperosmotically inducible protein
MGAIKVSQDRDKGVITLSGNVQSQNEKLRAENTARTVAPSYVLANEIGVRPTGFESEANKVDSNLDDAIEKQFEAALVSKQMNNGVKYEAKNGVLTLQGEVSSEKKRRDIETLASSIPNVKQVVNEVQVKGQKASSRG